MGRDEAESGVSHTASSVHMAPGRNTAKAVCMYVRDSATIVKFRTVLYLTTALTKADIHTAMEDSRK